MISIYKCCGKFIDLRRITAIGEIEYDYRNHCAYFPVYCQLHENAINIKLEEQSHGQLHVDKWEEYTIELLEIEKQKLIGAWGNK
jgi:hypothetical protein